MDLEVVLLFDFEKHLLSQLSSCESMQRNVVYKEGSEPRLPNDEGKKSDR